MTSINLLTINKQAALTFDESIYTFLFIQFKTNLLG